MVFCLNYSLSFDIFKDDNSHDLDFEAQEIRIVMDCKLKEIMFNLYIFLNLTASYLKDCDQFVQILSFKSNRMEIA